MRILFLILCSLSLVGQELPGGPGKKELEMLCSGCHGPEYVLGAPRMDRDGWREKVYAMIGTGAPEEQTAIKAVVEYLVKNFGPTDAPPAPSSQTAAASTSAASAPQAVSAAAGGKPPDYELFKRTVQPVFNKMREGYARCILCHSAGTNFRLAPIPSGATTWTEQQSRQNYEAVLRLVVPGDPEASRFLMHTLSYKAGGDPFHGGGIKFASKNDPDWQAWAAWVRTGSEPVETFKAAEVLDFDVYKRNVEPLLLNPREGGGAEGGKVPCFSCHTKETTRMRLTPLTGDSRTWTEAQSRKNFEVVAHLVVPGEPLKSPLFQKPLASSLGGTPLHAGGKFWTSMDDPEVKALVEFVNSRRK